MANTIAVTPDSTIRLLKCPIKLDDHNQFTFASVSAQTTYFQSLTYLESSSLTYIRKDNVIRVDTSGNIDYEDLLQYNYCMYKNTHYDSKWFYAYITDVVYKNDGCTEISIETDVFQTWYFNVTWQTSFIEREHVSNDARGAHTVPEGVELGEYVENGYEYTDAVDDVAFIVASTTDFAGSTTRSATNVCGIPYPGYLFVCKKTGSGSSLSTAFTKLKTCLTSFTDGNEKNIYCVYAIPDIALTGVGDSGIEQFPDMSAPVSFTLEYNKPTTVNGYTPKNNKVLTFPYCYALVSNNNGNSTVLKWENWTTTKATFQLVSIPTVGSDTKIVPTSYESGDHYEEQSLVQGKYPTLAWSRDLFTSWISQNAANIGIGVGASILQVVGGVAAIATGAGAVAGATMVTSGISGVLGTIGQVYQHSLDPVSAQGNVNAGGINVSMQRNGFYIYKMSIRSEYAQIIDNFFSTYGYKVNRIGTPNLLSRTYWNYCKTIDAHLSGNIPNQDMIKLKELFNNGCTFWHNTSYFMDYSRTNSIVT